MKRFKLKWFISILILILFFGCIIQKNPDDKKAIRSNIVPENTEMLVGNLWLQNAAEFRALSYQAFNIAKMRIDEELKIKRNKKRAIVVDLDGTLIDDSPYDVKMILTNRSYHDGWDEWVNMAIAKPLPGAKEFLTYASEKGFDIFYISNRKLKHLNGSMKNLKKFDFPQIIRSHFCFKDSVSSKEPRRQVISQSHYISLLIGDNLNDFSSVFEKKSINERFTVTDQLKEKFGSKFIVIPNPVYGSWLKILYDYKRNLTKEQRLQKQLEHLHTYE